MNTQLSIFEDAEEQVAVLENQTIVRLGQHKAAIPKQLKRRVALKRFLEILADLEGKTIHIGSYDAGGRHYWLDNLKLERLQVTCSPANYVKDHNYIPGVIVLWGSRGACIRIFTDDVVSFREQDYQGYWHYLLDFRNGFWESRSDSYRSHYACLAITRFKD